MQEGGKALASPAVRRVAREYGVDLASVTGTGPEGRVTKGEQSFVGCSWQGIVNLPQHGARGRGTKPWDGWRERCSMCRTVEEAQCLAPP